jgi:hypothetical protein
MSSSPLYLAIVVVWLIVLVPMLLRKDSPVDTTHEEYRREDADPEAEPAIDEHLEDEPVEPFEEELGEHPEDEQYEDQEALDTRLDRQQEPIPAPAAAPPIGEPRSRIIARRRRRTSGLTLLNIGTIVAVSLGLGPWWVLVPPVLLLAGHLVLLREAAKADAELREAARRARRRAELRRRREAEERRRDAQREAEVIALRKRRNQVYDQYVDARRRAAGD